MLKTEFHIYVKDAFEIVGETNLLADIRIEIAGSKSLLVDMMFETLKRSEEARAVIKEAVKRYNAEKV